MPKKSRRRAWEKSPQEQVRILKKLFSKGLNVTEVAREIGLSRQAVDQKIRKYDIPYDRNYPARKHAERRLQNRREENKELFEKIVSLLDQGYSFTKAGRTLFRSDNVKRTEERKFYYERISRILKLFEYKQEGYVMVDGRRLSQERKKKGLLQSDLGVQSHISTLENGARARRSTIERIADKLGVPAKDLIIFEKDKKRIHP